MILGLINNSQVIASNIPTVYYRFVYAHKQSIENGLPDTVPTYGLISGLWVAGYAMGNFLGPTLGGIFYDQVGFVKASYYVIGTQILLIVFLSILCCFQHSICYKPKGYDNIQSPVEPKRSKTMLTFTPR